MIEDTDNAGFTDRASVEVLHTILARQIDGLDACHRIHDLLRLLLVLALALHDVDLVADEDLDWSLACTLALSDPLLDALKSRSLRHIEQINDSC